MKLNFKRGLLSATLIAGCLTATSAFAEKVTLRFNQWFPVNHWSQQDGLYPYFDEIKRVTEGRVVVRPSAKPLAPPTKNYQAIQSGIADISWGPHGYTPGAFPLTEMVEFGFQIEDAGDASAAYWRTYKKFFEQTGMQDDVVTVAMHVTSGGNIHMREKAIVTPADFEGQKIRIQVPAVGDALKTLGGVPISGTLSELREMLSRGIIDGTMLSDELLTGFKVDKYVNQITQVPGGVYSSSAFVIINKDKWNQISKKDQDAIMAISGEKLSRDMGALWHKNDIEARAALKARLGDDYRVASPELVDAIKAAIAPSEKVWLDKAKAENVDGEAAWAFFKEETKKIASEK